MRALKYMGIGLTRLPMAASPGGRVVMRCATSMITMAFLIQVVSVRIAGAQEAFSQAELEELGKVVETTIEASEERQFAGMSFGVGIAATWIHHASDARIDDVELTGDPAVVRVKGRTRAPTRLLLESHYFFEHPKYKWLGLGPFLALQPGTGELVEAVGFGAMVGFRRTSASTQSFNIGLGGLIDASSPVLGSGVEADAPLPLGETVVRLQNRSVFSWLALFSFSF